MIEVLEGVHVDGRNIMVPKGAAIYRTDGLITDGQNVQPGIYVVRSSDRAVKIIVK